MPTHFSTVDFRNEGLAFSGLYRTIEIPLEWVGRDRYHSQWMAAIATYYEAYGKEPPERFDLDADTGEYIDFARLDETMQTQVILYLATDPSAKRHVLIDGQQPASEWLAGAGLPSEEVMVNRSAIAERYSLKSYGERLRHVYQQIIDCPAREEMIDPDAVLDAFLDPERFLFLRS